MSSPGPAKPPAKHNRKPSNASSHRSNRSRHSLDKIEIKINVYDLLPPGKVSNLFWFCGVGLLHTGVVIGDREYAFGGHDRRGVTGVYYTAPHQLPPGATHRTEFTQGFTFYSPTEISAILQHATYEFLGPSYNVLTRNCNHFTSYLCERLTGRPAPTWINRAAAIGVALPCVVPTAWVEPLAGDAEDEELLGHEEEGYGRGHHEREREDGGLRNMDDDGRWEAIDEEGEGWGSEEEEAAGRARQSTDQGRSHKTRDEDGRTLPRSERADLRTVL